MATIKEEAMAFEPTQVKNIAELKCVSVDLDVKTDHSKNKDGEEFTFKFIEVEGEKYRIPGIVLGSIKTIVEQRPDTKHVQVIRSGEGKATRYTVLPHNG